MSDSLIVIIMKVFFQEVLQRRHGHGPNKNNMTNFFETRILELCVSTFGVGEFHESLDMVWDRGPYKHDDNNDDQL
jgi:hypothetical protein